MNSIVIRIQDYQDHLVCEQLQPVFCEIIDEDLTW